MSLCSTGRRVTSAWGCCVAELLASSESVIPPRYFPDPQQTTASYACIKRTDEHGANVSHA